MSTGVIYIATGEKYINEAVTSATSLKRFNPDLPVTLFTDAAVNVACFDAVVPITSGPRPERICNNKIHLIGQSPYERTLYLDDDTYITGDLTELFALLDRFDIATAHAPVRISTNMLRLRELQPERPNQMPGLAFPEQNAGVILFRQSSRMKAFLHHWLEIYEGERTLLDNARQAYADHDQSSLREALYRSDLATAVLPSEYNCRACFPGYLHNPVQILHLHDPNLAGVAATLNSLTGFRIHFIRQGRLIVTNHAGETRTLRLVPWHRFGMRYGRSKLQRFLTSEIVRRINGRLLRLVRWKGKRQL
jgi:hypothetical protein